MHEVIELRVIDQYIVHLRFSDGHEKLVDFEPYIGKGISAALLDKDYFSQVAIDDNGGIFWPNGYDFCPNYLYEDVPSIEPSSIS